MLAGEVDAGVLIHEGRFTYAERGLVKLCDLGEVWEERTGTSRFRWEQSPCRRSLGAGCGAQRIDGWLRASVEYALANPEASAAFVREHAAGDGPRRRCARHIELYVNEFTLGLDPRMVESLLRFAEDDTTDNAHQPIFAS